MELILAVAHLFKGDGSTAPERTMFHRALSAIRKETLERKSSFHPGIQRCSGDVRCSSRASSNWDCAGTACCSHHGIDAGPLRLCQVGERSKIQHSTARCSMVQHGPVQYSTAQSSTAQHGTAQYSTAQCSTARHGTARHDAARHGGAPATSNLHRGSPASALPRIPIPIATEHLGGTAQCFCPTQGAQQR